MNDTRKRRRAAWIALAILAAVPPAAARAQQPAEAPDAALAVAALEELATWCHRNKLYGKRSEVYEAILVFDADHTRARRGLKHSKKRGLWVEPAKPYRPKNKDDEALAAFPERRIAALAPYVRGVLDSLDARGLRVTDDEARRAIALALEVSPDDPDLRALLGDVKVHGRWMMEETARAALLREQLEALCEDARARADARAEVDELRPADVELGAEWRAAVLAGPVRVLATTTVEEARRAAALQLAAGDVVRGLFRLRPGAPDEARVFLLARGEQHAFLARVPGLGREQREFYGRLAGTTFPGDFRAAHWGPDEAHRLDAVTRFRVDDLLAAEFGIEHRDGWVWEGLGGYLTWRIAGTRLTWRVAGSAERADSDALAWRDLFATPPDRWLLLAHRVLGEEGELDLERTLSGHLDDLDALDVLTSHALAAYLVEGRGELADVLRAMRRQGAAGALCGTLGLDLDALERRLVRWLDERVLPEEVLAADLAEPVLAALVAPDDPLLSGLLGAGGEPATK